MHTAVIVIGDNPAERAQTLLPHSIDWAAIGGRYTGALVPVEGAASAKTYGETVPAFDAMLSRVVSDAAPDMGMVRIGAGRYSGDGAGVDQVRRAELDVAATVARFTQPASHTLADRIANAGHCPGYVVTADDHFHGDPFSKRDDAAWLAEIAALLEQVAPDALVTVVDIHV